MGAARCSGCLHLEPLMREHFEGKYLRDAQTGCWNWLLSKDRTGYGFVSIKSKTKYAHRVAFETFVGEIPAGMDLDHLCRNRSCVNPKHLEPVTRKENVRRGAGLGGVLREVPSHCRHGHLLSKENTYSWRGDKARRCKVCNREAQSRYGRRRVS